MMSYRRMTAPAGPRLGVGERFGLRSARQVIGDLAEVARASARGDRFQFNARSLGILRPGLSLPAYAGLVPRDGLAPIFNLFDRTAGGQRYRQRVARTTCRDFRGGTLTYDEHDGTDLVCPVGTPLCAAAPGVVAMVRHRWLRGGLTVAVDHGDGHGGGVVTQYTHCGRALVEPGQPVRRGDPVALSGAAGYDLVQFFPWVAPHIHFAVFVRGRPVDPYLAPGERAHAGAWLHGDDPRPSGPLPDDPAPAAGDVDEAAAARVAAACTDPGIADELARVSGNRTLLAALVEDALFHDAWAFPPALHGVAVRPAPAAPARITLPLPASDYRGARLADTRWSHPAAGARGGAADASAGASEAGNVGDRARASD